MRRTLIGHSTEPDFDGEKHEWMQYKYKEYIFNKEWYVNIENEYIMGLTIFKLGKKNKLIPTIKHKGKYYNEIFHAGYCNDVPDDAAIELAELMISNKEK